jgi:hypothetical protein
MSKLYCPDDLRLCIRPKRVEYVAVHEQFHCQLLKEGME